MSEEMTQTSPAYSEKTALETVQAMKQERLKLGLSLEQVAAKAGISSGLLRRLEAGELDQIGNAEIIQNALRAYGAFLQTDQTHAAEAVMTVDSQAADLARSHVSSRPKRRRTLALSLLIVAAVAAAIAVFFWRYSPLEERPQGAAIMGNLSFGREFGNDSSRQLADQPNFIRTQLAQHQPVASTPPIEATVTEGAADKTVQPAQHADQDRELPNREQAQSPGATTATGDDYSEPLGASAEDKEQRLLGARNNQPLPQPSVTELPQLSAKTDSAQPASRGEAGHTLELEATADCWIEVQIDQLKPQRELLKPGEQRTYSVNQKAGLIIGNAGGVRIKWDGQLLTPAGKPGKVIRLKLPRAP